MEQIDLQTIITIIGVAITGLIAILTLSFWLGRYHGKINYHEKSIDGMKIDLDDVKSDLVEVKTTVSVILEKLNWLEKLRQPIENMTHDDGTSYVSSNSPLSINQEGRKVSEKIGAEKTTYKIFLKKGYYRVATTFRAKNSFGGYIRAEVIADFNEAGDLLRVIKDIPH